MRARRAHRGAGVRTVCRWERGTLPPGARRGGNAHGFPQMSSRGTSARASGLRVVCSPDLARWNWSCAAQAHPANMTAPAPASAHGQQMATNKSRCARCRPARGNTTAVCRCGGNARVLITHDRSRPYTHTHTPYTHTCRAFVRRWARVRQAAVWWRAAGRAGRAAHRVEVCPADPELRVVGCAQNSVLLWAKVVNTCHAPRR